MAQSEVETGLAEPRGNGASQCCVELPIAATANKTEGNEGVGQGKGDNRGQVS